MSDVLQEIKKNNTPINAPPPPRAKIVVCICSLDTVLLRWVVRMYAPLLRGRPNLSFQHMIRFTASPHSIGQKRDGFVMWMLQNAPDATHIFFLDNDVILEGGMDILDAIDQMVKLDLDIVSGCIRTKKPPDLEIMLYKQDKEKHFHALKSIDFTKKTIEVDGVGAGFLLIKKDMFYKIQRPWFQVHTLEETMTEDIEFCLRAKKAGYKIYAYTGVHLSHIGYFAVRLDQLIGDVWSEAQ